jgi:hypothetical protein
MRSCGVLVQKRPSSKDHPDSPAAADHKAALSVSVSSQHYRLDFTMDADTSTASTCAMVEEGPMQEAMASIHVTDLEVSPLSKAWPTTAIHGCLCWSQCRQSQNCLPSSPCGKHILVMCRCPARYPCAVRPCQSLGQCKAAAWMMPPPAMSSSWSPVP